MNSGRIRGALRRDTSAHAEGGGQVDIARWLMLLGGWAAAFFGLVGSVALEYSSSPMGTDYAGSLRTLGISPQILVFWLALPSICVALGATAAALSSRASWLHLMGEALLLIGVTANVGLGGYMLTAANWSMVALAAVPAILAIAVGVAFVVGELSGEPTTTRAAREQE